MLASSGEVHGVLGIIVDLNCLGQRLGVPAITLARHVAAFSTVMVFVYQVIAGSESH